MAKITHKGLWLDIASLNPSDKKNYIKCLAFSLVAGMLLGIHLSHIEFLGENALETGITEPWLLILSISVVVFFLIGAFYYYKFSITQDELYKGYENACFAGGSVGFVIFGLGLSLLSPYFDYHPIFFEFFLAFAAGNGMGAYMFYRQHIE